MKVAVTADVHLSTGKDKRFENLESIINNLLEEGINTIVVAGDLFDKGYEGYIELDNLIDKYPKFNIIAIPGNHDQQLDQSKFNSKNIRVISSPEIESIDKKQFLFLPYQERDTIGGVIEKNGFEEKLEKGQWYLISHGDYGRINRKESGNEGGYFPLTRKDISKYKPQKVILGHIHAANPLDSEVIYPGSPYPLDITEIGQRRILVLDIKNDIIESKPLAESPVFMRKEIMVLPDGMEREQIENQLERFFAESEEFYTGEGFYSKLTMRLIISGYTTSREGIEEFSKTIMKGKGITIDRIDIDSLKTADDESLNVIALEAEARIKELKLDYDGAEELKILVLKQAYNMVYGG